MAKPKRKGKKRARPSNHHEDSEDPDDNDNGIDFLTTDPKSPFVHMDLIAEYSSPEFHALLTDQDKIEIAELLPDHISLTPEGFFHDEFVRYDMDFRNGIRLYQNDLAEGRYDPEWLRQAAEAMEQRAAGDFDDWKEREFEEFWGQKQRLDPNARAGQSGTIKLNRLVEAGLFKEGDVFSYMRVFGRGKGKFTVEKDVKVIDIDGTTMTFAIPPGQRKFARRLAPRQTECDEPQKTTVSDDELADGTALEAKIGSDSVSEGNNAYNRSQAPDLISNNTIDDKPSAHGAMNGEPTERPSNANGTDRPESGAKPAEAHSTHVHSSVNHIGDKQVMEDGIEDSNPLIDSANNEDALKAHPSPASSTSQLSEIPSDVDDSVIASINTLQALEEKIVSIDGRLKKRVDGNAFKNIRVKRDNQDIGSLFEIREEWYAYKK